MCFGFKVEKQKALLMIPERIHQELRSTKRADGTLLFNVNGRNTMRADGRLFINF